MTLGGGVDGQPGQDQGYAGRRRFARDPFTSQESRGDRTIALERACDGRSEEHRSGPDCDGVSIRDGGDGSRDDAA
jgi:hypothetical protein